MSSFNMRIRSFALMIMMIVVCVLPVCGDDIGKIPPERDLSMLKLPPLDRFCLTELKYPEDDSISIVPAEMIFSRAVPDISSYARINQQTENQEGKKVSSLRSWLMSVEKWKRLVPLITDEEFRWGSLQFPLIWETIPDSEGKIPFIDMDLFRRFQAVPENDFKELLLRARQWIEHDKHSAETFRSLLEKGDPRERDFAIRMLVLKNDKESLPLIKKNLLSRELQAICLDAIQAMGSENDIHDLIKAFYTPGGRFVGRVIEVMCLVGGPKVNPELRDWLNDPGIAVNTKWQILSGIEQSNYKPAIKILVPLLKDKQLGAGVKELLMKLGYMPTVAGQVLKECRTKDGVILQISLPKSNYDPLDPVVMTILATNNSNTDIVINKGINVSTQVFFSDGNLTPKTSFTLAPAMYQPDIPFLTLKPNPQPPRIFSVENIPSGRSYSSNYNLSQFFDLSLSADYYATFQTTYSFVGDDDQPVHQLIIEKIPFTVK